MNSRLTLAAANRCLTTRRPRVIGHRGAALRVPENTLASLAAARDAGADILEIDIHMTVDGHIVVCHDKTVDRTTNGAGRIADLTLSQLKQLDAGYRFTGDGGKTFPFRGQGISIPTLAEVFEAFDLPMLVEIKTADERLLKPLVELLDRHGRFESVIIQVFSISRKLVRRLRSLDPRVITGHSTAEIATFCALMRFGVQRLFRRRALTFEVPVKKKRYPIVTPRFVRLAHALGIEVFVWTINNEAEMRRLLAMGVDGIYSDDPALLRKVTDEGLWRKRR